MNKSKSLNKTNPIYGIVIVITLFSSIFFSCSNANKAVQNPNRFNKEIKKIASLPVPESDSLVVFTGSSSIRLWKDLEKRLQWI